MPATRCRVVWPVPVSRPWPESLSSGLASWWSSIFAPPIARLARLRLARLAIGDDAHHFVNNVRSNPNFSTLDPYSNGADDTDDTDDQDDERRAGKRKCKAHERQAAQCEHSFVFSACAHRRSSF